MEIFYHTIGDTEPFEFKHTRNGVPFDLTGYSVALFVTLPYDTTPILNGVAMTVLNQGTKKGVASYAFTSGDETALGVGIFHARTVATKDADIKTFPTDDFDEAFVQINILPST
jgi:hypothetical protein